MQWHEWLPISRTRQIVQHMLGVVVLLIAVRLINEVVLFLIDDESVRETLHLIESFVAVSSVLIVSIEFLVMLGKAALTSLSKEGEDNGQV